MSTALAVCLGDSCIDTYLPPFQRSFVGGNAVNVAVALQQAGSPSTFCGTIGDDPEGVFILQALKDKGVDTSQIQVDPGATHRTFIHLNSAEDHQFAHELMAERSPFRPTQGMLAFASRQRLVHCNWLGEPMGYLPALSSDPDLILTMDYGHNTPAALLDGTLALISVAFFTLPPGRSSQAQAFAPQMAARGPRQVVILLGAEGSLVYDGRMVYRQPALPVETVDTLGAGDAYIGTYLAGFLQEHPIKECMLRATRAASQACTHLGAWPGAEIANLRKSQ